MPISPYSGGDSMVLHSLLLSENVQEHMPISGLGATVPLLNFILVCKGNVTMFVVKYHSRSILHAQMD
jgi:hypothetical protein